MENKEYPQNLIDTLSDNVFNKPKIITDDVMTGVDYAVSTLKPEERNFIRCKFQKHLPMTQICDELRKSPDEIAKLEKTSILKLRHPWVYKYILHGIEGYALHKSITEFFHGYWLGYQDAKKGARNKALYSFSPRNSKNCPGIEQLGLNKKTYNCLTRAGIITIGDCLKLREKDIKEIRGLGVKGADEVAKSICAAQIYSYSWEHFLEEPVETRGSNFYHVEIK